MITATVFVAGVLGIGLFVSQGRKPEPKIPGHTVTFATISTLDMDKVDDAMKREGIEVFMWTSLMASVGVDSNDLVRARQILKELEATKQITHVGYRDPVRVDS